MMNSQEIETAVRLGLNLVVTILNDSSYGMIRWKQSHAGFEDFGLEFDNPDFVKYAESYGASGHRVEATEDLIPTFNKAFEAGGVHIVEIPVDYSENQKVLIDEVKGSVVCGGEKLSDTTYAPTVLLNPANDAKVSTMEIFGPAVSVYGYKDMDQAIEQANALPFAFQASVFTKNLDTAMSAIQNLDATAVMVNDHTAFRVDWMPFAGRRHSGYNTGGIGYTMHDMTQDKMAVIKV